MKRIWIHDMLKFLKNHIFLIVPLFFLSLLVGAVLIEFFGPLICIILYWGDCC